MKDYITAKERTTFSEKKEKNYFSDFLNILLIIYIGFSYNLIGDM